MRDREKIIIEYCRQSNEIEIEIEFLHSSRLAGENENNDD